jgi:3-dehydroquinate synthetase
MLPMCAPAVRSRLAPVLEGLGLPTAVRADPAAVYAALMHDKKMADGAITAVYVDTPGRCELRKVSPEALRAGIEMVVKA